jgi:two-component system chemotaxis response regulator CheB
MPSHPLPVVLVSSLNIGALDALHAGAVDFVQKPDVKNGSDFAVFSKDLGSKIKIASMAKVKKDISATSMAIPSLKLGKRNEQIIAIGASTGGTEATAEILQQLPANIPGIVVTQHMPAGFTKMYADRLNRICKMTVSEARNGDRIKDGTAYIAAGDMHLTVEKDARGYYVKCAAGEKVSGHCPSVDVLFRSVAKAAGKEAIGVILTGMGKDGAQGLLEMRNSGSYTFGQDRASCVVYGMPMVANQMGAVVKEASCHDIAGLIIQRLNR